MTFVLEHLLALLWSSDELSESDANILPPTANQSQPLFRMRAFRSSDPHQMSPVHLATSFEYTFGYTLSAGMPIIIFASCISQSTRNDTHERS